MKGRMALLEGRLAPGENRTELIGGLEEQSYILGGFGGLSTLLNP